MARIFGPHVRQGYRDRLGALVREVRTERGVQQQELARLLGVPSSVLSKIEKGERGLDVLEARAVCLALGVPLAVFVQRLEDELVDDA